MDLTYTVLREIPDAIPTGFRAGIKEAIMSVKKVKKVWRQWRQIFLDIYIPMRIHILLISKFQNLHHSFRHYSVILIFKIYAPLRRSGKTGNGTPPARSSCEFQNIENKDQGDFRMTSES